MNKFGEILFLAGAAAANSESAAHRAIAVRDTGELGTDWTADLPNSKAQLVEAIVATIRALAAAPSPEFRKPIAQALRELVRAGRTPLPRPVVKHRGEPRCWWLEAEQ